MIDELKILKENKSKLRNLERLGLQNMMFMIEDSLAKQDVSLRGDIEIELIVRLMKDL